MHQRQRISVVARRDIIVGSAAGAALLALLGTGARAQEKAPGNGLDEALKKIMGDAKPADGKILLDLPEIAESGNTVPYALSVDSPMTEKEHVKGLHIMAAGNPQHGVASFVLSPASGKAHVAGRLRLARTQEVVALAEMSDGRFILGRRLVKVTIGGCGG